MRLQRYPKKPQQAVTVTITTATMRPTRKKKLMTKAIGMVTKTAGMMQRTNTKAKTTTVAMMMVGMTATTGASQTAIMRAMRTVTTRATMRR